MLTSVGSNFTPSGLGTGKGHCMNMMAGNGFDHISSVDHKRSKKMWRKPCIAKQLLQRQRTLRHAGSMFQNTSITRHQRGSGEADHLKEWKIPRHHTQHDANRIIGNIAFVRIGLDHLDLHKMLGMHCIIITGKSTFFHLGTPLAQGLPHFHSH